MKVPLIYQTSTHIMQTHVYARIHTHTHAHTQVSGDHEWEVACNRQDTVNYSCLHMGGF